MSDGPPSIELLLNARQPVFRRRDRTAEGPKRRRLELRQQVYVILVDGDCALERRVRPATATERNDVDTSAFAGGDVIR